MLVGIGCDIVKIDRIEAFLNKGLKLNFLTDKEKAICNEFAFHRKAEWIAGRFAAKEAIYKAIHNAYESHICDYEILVNEDGSPSCHIDGFIIHLSIAHEKEYAIAYVMVEKEK